MRRSQITTGNPDDFKERLKAQFKGSGFTTLGIELPSSKTKNIECVAFLVEFWQQFTDLPGINVTKIEHQSRIVKIIQVYPSRAQFQRFHPDVYLFKSRASCWDQRVIDHLNKIKSAFNLSSYLCIPPNLVVG